MNEPSPVPADSPEPERRADAPIEHELACPGCGEETFPHEEHACTAETRRDLWRASLPSAPPPAAQSEADMDASALIVALGRRAERAGPGDADLMRQAARLLREGACEVLGLRHVKKCDDREMARLLAERDSARAAIEEIRAAIEDSSEPGWISQRQKVLAILARRSL